MRNLLVLTTLFLTSCAGMGPHIHGGSLLTNLKGPIVATTNTAASKSGEACSNNFLGMIAFGDNSIDKAKNKASITKVSSVDYDRFSLLFGIYTKVCTIVKGE